MGWGGTSSTIQREWKNGALQAKFLREKSLIKDSRGLEREYLYVMGELWRFRGMTERG